MNTSRLLVKLIKKRVNLLIVFCLVLATAGLLSIGLNRPFWGHHDANNQMYRLAALNYLKHGLWETKLGQVISPPTEIMAAGHFYTHHPPLLSLFLALSIGVLGDGYWTVRIVPLLFSSFTVGIFFLLLKKYFSLAASLLAIGFWLVSPMFLFFGKMANHEPLTLFFMTLALYGWVNNKKKLLYLSLFLGQWTGWPAYYLAAILFVFTRDCKLLVLSFVDLILFFGHTFLLTGSLTGGGLVEIFLFRTGISHRVGDVVETYTIAQFLRQELLWTYHFFNPVLVWISSLGVILAFKKKQFGEREKIALALFFTALIHVFLFRTGANRHDYWLYYFLPFFTWMAGFTFFSLSTKKTLFRRWTVYVIGILFLVAAVFEGQPFFWALQNRIEMENVTSFETAVQNTTTAE